MNKALFASRPALMALAAMGSALAAATAGAQDTTNEIVVQAPPLVVTQQVGRSSIGAPIEQVTLTHRVSYRDLNLAMSTDAAKLRTRVDDEARLACKQLYQLYPLVATDPDCVKKTLKDAMAQADAAITAAGAGPR
jgi:UrcA family protein